MEARILILNLILSDEIEIKGATKKRCELAVFDKYRFEDFNKGMNWID